MTSFGPHDISRNRSVNVDRKVKVQHSLKDRRQCSVKTRQWPSSKQARCFNLQFRNLKLVYISASGPGLILYVYSRVSYCPVFTSDEDKSPHLITCDLSDTRLVQPLQENVIRASRPGGFAASFTFVPKALNWFTVTAAATKRRPNLQASSRLFVDNCCRVLSNLVQRSSTRAVA